MLRGGSRVGGCPLLGWNGTTAGALYVHPLVRRLHSATRFNPSSSPILLSFHSPLSSLLARPPLHSFRLTGTPPRAFFLSFLFLPPQPRVQVLMDDAMLRRVRAAGGAAWTASMKASTRPLAHHPSPRPRSHCSRRPDRPTLWPVLQSISRSPPSHSHPHMSAVRGTYSVERTGRDPLATRRGRQSKVKAR
jgi:hypothetical protein